MFWKKIKRAFKSGVVNFFRNGSVTLSSVFDMGITLFVICALIILGGLFNYSLEKVKEKVDVNVYFITSASEKDVLNIKKSLEGLIEVEKVDYVSRDQALINFKEKHKTDELTLQALNEIGTNPLGASLNIKAKEPSQYEGIAEFLKSSNALSKDGGSIIDKVNYAQNKISIDRLTSITHSVNVMGIWIAIIFVIISILTTFNTTKLTIFMAKDEISVMHLVGASRRYVKFPFIVSGVLCGLISSIIVIILFTIGILWISHSYSQLLVGFDLSHYFFSNFLYIFLVIVGSGVLLGALSSYLAVRKYLRD